MGCTRDTLCPEPPSPKHEPIIKSRTPATNRARDACETEIDQTKARFIGAWPSTAGRLRKLPISELEALPTQELAQAPRTAVIDAVEQEILDGALNGEPEYGMRLDNVGPRVREAFKTSGKTVRDLRVNKSVRVSNRHDQINPLRTDGAFLITADGHIRLTGWPLPLAELAPTAEHAQDLPLSYLKV